MRKIIMMAALVIACAGCSGEKGKELYETAQFEEKQNNREHAVQLYEELVKKYPESDAGKRAAARLAEMKGRK